MTSDEFGRRFFELDAAASHFSTSFRAQVYMVSILAFLDAAKMKAKAGAICTEDEFVSFCRLLYRKVRDRQTGSNN